jgi:hypothetical protein
MHAVATGGLTAYARLCSERRGGCYTSFKILVARVSHIGIATRADRDGSERLGSRASPAKKNQTVLRMHARILVATALVLLLGCGGGVSEGQSINATVQVTWTANRETAVNSTGGGYKVYFGRTANFDIAGASFVDVPFVAPGPLAPTTATLTLSSGTNYIKIVAYSALNPAGSAPSAAVSVNVPFAAASVASRD